MTGKTVQSFGFTAPDARGHPLPANRARPQPAADGTERNAARLPRGPSTGVESFVESPVKLTFGRHIAGRRPTLPAPVSQGSERAQLEYEPQPEIQPTHPAV